MSSTPSHRSARSNASSFHHPAPAPDLEASVPIETLVEHLLAAKRSLAAMAAVVRANEICNFALRAYEESVVLAAETEYLRRGMGCQLGLLARVRRSLNGTYDAGKKEFKQLIKLMDAADGKMRNTVGNLRHRTVQEEFREGEGDGGERNLMDFVDEKSVQAVVDSLKTSVKELQAIQTSFDGDILRFETEIRALKKAIAASSTRPSSPDESHQPISTLLFSLTDHSQNMAALLSSLTKHFDLCVTAVRTTEGGAALARRRAAESTQSQEGPSVSISGVIAEQESHVADLEPITSQDRNDMTKIVVEDASEVEGVVREINEQLAAMESELSALEERASSIRVAYRDTLEAFRALEDVGGKLVIYAAAESEFLARWEDEKAAIFSRLEEMEQLREFYEGYASAYDRLLVEVDRRRAVEDRVRAIWRRAAESVDKIMQEDAHGREAFMQDVGEFLPTDLWPDMNAGMKRWEVRPAQDESSGVVEKSTPALSRSVVDAAKGRLGGGR